MFDKICIYNKIWGNFKLKFINDRYVYVNVKLNIFLWMFLYMIFCVLVVLKNGSKIELN